jgi:deoxyadenosine/deoxycytidine kinase
MQTHKRFIAIAGNIGAGKTSLAARLAGLFDWRPFFEPVEENPYLADFYQDMRRWGFHSQVFFLARRLHHYRGLLDWPASVIQDRSVYEDAEIFARNLYLQGHLSDREWASYHDLYDAVASLLPPPDLVVYLRASVPTLMERITRRGRELERRIDPAYIAQLNRLYEEWIAAFRRCPVLVVPVDELNPATDEGHLKRVADDILSRLV